MHRFNQDATSKDGRKIIGRNFGSSKTFEYARQQKRSPDAPFLKSEVLKNST